MKISEILRTGRMHRKLTQSKVVKLYNERNELPITQDAYCKYEKGRVMPPADKYQQLLDILWPHYHVGGVNEGNKG